MIRTRCLGVALVLSAAIVAGCQKKTESPAAEATPAGPAVAVTDERLLNAANEPSQWLTYGGTYSEQRFSKLDKITPANVKTLGLSWFADYDTNLQQTGVPLYVDGALFVSTAWGKVYAFDAKTGKQIWQWNPKVPGEWAQKVCCGLVNRGLAAYDGKIYVGTLDARLVAIDAKTGKEAWATSVIEGDPNLPVNRYSVTMAPRIAKGKVFIGASGGEFGVRGFIAAYDAKTGQQAWRFWTVPGDPAKGDENEALKKARATWGKGDWWKLGGGGTVWDAAVYDPTTDLLYFGTGNGTPWNARDRDPTEGDNLYLTSVIAVKPDTGEYVWHYQTVPADTWDYDSVSPMMTADIEIKGQTRHVLLQPNKNGMYYVWDAKTGELLLAEPFTTVNWNTGVDLKTGKAKIVKASRYPVGTTFNLAPGVQGGHGWHSNAYSPDTGLLYIATQDAWFPLAEDPNYKPADVGFNLGIDFGASFTYPQRNPTARTGFVGFLQAIDPATGKQVWKSRENQGPTGGAMATAGGLVFQGNGQGTPAQGAVVGPGQPPPPPSANPEPSVLRAFDAKTGEVLWSFETQTSALPAPITYELDGKQYVAASVGGNQTGGYFAPNYSRLLVFELGGTAQLPPVKEYTPPPLDPPASTADATVISAGEDKYGQYCAVCHGANGQTRGATFPDLTRTPLLHTQAGFDQVVLQGARTEKGMASFANALSAQDSVAVREYIIARANALKSGAPPGGAGPGAGAPPQPARQAGAHEEN